MHNKFYCTTPIYYPTARPHLGSLYSTVLADVATRWHHLLGKRTLLAVGTDEHGQKIAEAAAKAGVTPQEFVDAVAPTYKQLWHQFNINYGVFVRTTDATHTAGVQEWLKKLIEKGDIYKAMYEGWYCVPCETFVTEKDAHEPACPTCGRATVRLQEESYFFKLSAYQERLLTFFKAHPDFITPRERFAEVIRFVEDGLKDLSISRTTLAWGIPFPADERHVTYVWADALNNYLTAIGYGDAARQGEVDFWWPADLQVMGKDIVRFHAVYWPAFLMAAGLAAPKKLLVHGWIKVGHEKMSKSLGNVVDPQELLVLYGADPLRYYLVSHLAVTHDGEFSTKELEQKINADLANNIGNLINRVVQLAAKYDLAVIPGIVVPDESVQQLQQQCNQAIQDVTTLMESCSFHMATARAMTLANQINAFIHQREPWKLAKADRQQFVDVLSAVCAAIRVLAHLLWPVMPEKMSQLLGVLGLAVPVDGRNIIEQLLHEAWDKQFSITQGPILFTKIEREEENNNKKVLRQAQDVRDESRQDARTDITGLHKTTESKDQKKDNAEQKNISSDSYNTSSINAQIAIAANTQATHPELVEGSISIEDVIKVELVVGTIEQCEEIPKSDKLLKLQVNFGERGMRQVLSGIKQWYKPADLIGQQSVFVFNLKPRMMLGLESQGMILTAKDEGGNLQRVVPTAAVPNGTVLK